MNITSHFEEVQQEENLENDEKPPDPGGILFNRNFFLKMVLGVKKISYDWFQLFVLIYKEIGFKPESNIAFCN